MASLTGRQQLGPSPIAHMAGVKPYGGYEARPSDPSRCLGAAASSGQIGAPVTERYSMSPVIWNILIAIGLALRITKEPPLNFRCS